MPAYASTQPDSSKADKPGADAEADETALKHLRTYLSTTDALLPHVDGSHSPVLVTSTDLSEKGPQILYANQAYCEMMGYSLGEILGDILSVFHGPETDAVAVKKMREELMRTGFAKAELVRYRKNGESFRSYVTASRMSDDAPGPGVFLFVEHKVPKRPV